jgi:hypothetical protein
MKRKSHGALQKVHVKTNSKTKILNLLDIHINQSKGTIQQY